MAKTSLFEGACVRSVVVGWVFVGIKYPVVDIWDAWRSREATKMRISLFSASGPVF